MTQAITDMEPGSRRSFKLFLTTMFDLPSDQSYCSLPIFYYWNRVLLGYHWAKWETEQISTKTLDPETSE